MCHSQTPLFLIGAGFNADARREAGSIRGQSLYIGDFEIDCRYPLLTDLGPLCFPHTDEPIAHGDVEELLAAALDQRDFAPLERLCSSLLKADYYLAPRLLGRNANPNPYAQFLTRFPNSHFLTFNYDAFLEYGLFVREAWEPGSGFGIPVAYDLGFTAAPYRPAETRVHVIHLHGSLMVYTRDFTVSRPDDAGTRWLEMQDPPDFMFDPYSLGNLFYPLSRVEGQMGYSPRIHERVIAPVPEKANELKGAFVQGSRQKALDLLGQHSCLVSIGYAWNPSDQGTYRALLSSVPDGGRVVIVSPDADSLVDRLCRDYPSLTWSPHSVGFSEWSRAGFPL